MNCADATLLAHPTLLAHHVQADDPNAGGKKKMWVIERR
jgi:hypothetical protein